MKPDRPNVDTPLVRDGNPDKRVINFSKAIRSRLLFLLAEVLGISSFAYFQHRIRMDIQQCEGAIGKSRSEIALRKQEVIRHLVRVPGGLGDVGSQNLSHLEVRNPPPDEAECARLRQKLMATKKGIERHPVQLCTMGSAVEDLDKLDYSMIRLDNDFQIACPGYFLR